MKNGSLHLILIITLLLCSCHLTRRATSNDTYAKESIKKSEKSPLAGKKICIDPGHGGTQTGAVGATGLTEKEVNLKEAKMLKKMLEEAGAEVVLTRTDDSNVTITDRWKFNRAQKTDLFVSMHHNANAQGDTSMNRMEVFYHWKDRGGPSKDAAYLLFRELKALLDLPGKPYMCWAYGVLRENSYPAVLAEPSYLQNPEEEKRLKDEEYLRSISGAYYRAIVKFFEGGRPEIKIEDNIKVGADGIIKAKIIRPEGTALIDPQRIHVEVDKEPITNLSFHPETGDLEIHLSGDIDTGKHQLVLAARNIVGHTSDVFRGTFETKDIKPVENENELFQGVLKGKVIILDPEWGGDDPGPIGEKGLRACDANLETSFYLYDYLKRAGADVSMTRRLDKSMDNVSRVRFGLERNPSIFVTIGHRMPEPGMGEKPNIFVSRIGSRWSGGKKIGNHMIYHLRRLLGTGKELGDIRSREPFPGEVHNWSSWEAMHAAQEYTATYVCPMMFDAPGVEERLSTTAGLRKEALAIFFGLLDYYELNDREMVTIKGTVVNKETGKPLKDALVWVDGEIMTQTEDDGAFLFAFIDAGKHEIRVMHQDFETSEKDMKVSREKTMDLKIEMKP